MCSFNLNSTNILSWNFNFTVKFPYLAIICQFLEEKMCDGNKHHNIKIIILIFALTKESIKRRVFC